MEERTLQFRVGVVVIAAAIITIILVMVLGEGPTGAADTARARPDRFRELFRSQYPQWQPSAVFEILDASR